MSEKIEWFETQFIPDNLMIVSVSETENPLHNTGSNIYETSYDESASNETDSRAKELAYLLTLEPIEDGYFHPAEQLLEDSLKGSKFGPNHWGFTAYFQHIASDPTLAAGVRTLLGRCARPQIGEWGIVLAVNGLSHRDIEVREAAVRALERWGGHEAFEALKARMDIEPISRLAAYIRQVIRDLED